MEVCGPVAEVTTGTKNGTFGQALHVVSDEMRENKELIDCNPGTIDMVPYVAWAGGLTPIDYTLTVY